MNNRELFVRGDSIIISFPYSLGIIARIKEELADYRYDKYSKEWSIPATTFHARQARKFGVAYQFKIDPSVSRMANNDNQPEVTVDSIFDKKLRKFQKEAVVFLINNGGRGMLADEMGLGKTVEALAYLKQIEASNVLVVCPASVIYKWKYEVDRWLGWDCCMITSTKVPINPESRIYLVTYNLMTMRYNELLKHPFTTIIFDECHYISNDKASRSMVASRLAVGKDHVIGLSGTPFLNRPIEMYSMLSILDPISYSNRFKYAQRYCDAQETPFGWDMKGHSNEKELKERVRDILLRRTKKDVKMELPDLQRIVHMIDTDDKAYNHALTEARKHGDREALMILHKFMGLAKIDPTVDLAEDILMDPEQKLVIYAHHKEVVQQIGMRLMKNHAVSFIVGETTKEERAKRIKEFQHSNGIQAMIISEAGGEGIDLFAANKIVFAERAWNPGKEMQAEARLHRIGQKNPVDAYYIVLRNTLDEKVHNMIEEKRGIFMAILDNDKIETSILNGLSKYLRKGE